MPGTLDKYQAVKADAGAAGEWADGDEQEDEGEWDGEWDEDDYDDDDEYDEDYDDGGDELEVLEALQVGTALKRPVMNGPNRVYGAGIHTIEIYYPQFYISQIEMEEYDARPDRYGPSVIGKYTKGIGQIEARMPTDDEDPVSFAMTAVHRLLERMEREGFNETGRWSDDGKTLNIWHCVGRLDIGSESLIDRSKSMKSYVMDIFERYGGNTGNIEGVDMYNACYGGQAAGLAALSWVESDRWDGRYGIACGDDIAEVHSMYLFAVGASCSAALFYPNAPLRHHSQRASCILHRWDFFKPVGWHSMNPLSDGKYSIDAYMSAIDVCYQGLKKKMNGVKLLSLVDFNAFHTGGGYHVVKKAFLRMCQSDDPSSNKAQREAMLEKMLIPSCHILKLIGPCHTSSSFLNMASVCMSQYETAVGKKLMVFTYGSGCAASMYQTHFDDIPWFPPLGVWKAQFYRYAIKVTPYVGGVLQDIYCYTWMLFEWNPKGRELTGFTVDTLEEDVYYLIHLDTWGRRNYHRGGLKTKPLEMRHRVVADGAEFRKMREDVPDFKPQPMKDMQDKAAKVETLEDKWKDIEFKAIQGTEVEDVFVEETTGKLNADSKVKVYLRQEQKKPENFGVPDSGTHTYSIVGSWSSWQKVEPMTAAGPGVFTYKVVVGENGWEEFYIAQDGDLAKRIYPAQARSWKAQVCVGPHDGGEGKNWLIDTRDKPHVPEEDYGSAGDVFLVTFSWKKDSVKQLVWEKLDEKSTYTTGKYAVCGQFTCWDPLPMRDEGEGQHSVEVQLTKVGLDFHVMRNKDSIQLIYPEADAGVKLTSELGARVLGPATSPTGDVPPLWSITGQAGEIFKISFFRDPSDPDDIDLAWEKVDRKPVEEPKPRYFLVGTINDWNVFKSLELKPMEGSSGSYMCSVTLASKTEEFYIVVNRSSSLTIVPDKVNCSQYQMHSVIGPAEREGDTCWSIGKAATDKARVGDVFQVQFDAQDNKVSWSK